MQALPSHPFDSGTPRKRRTGYSAPALSSDHGRLAAITQVTAWVVENQSDNSAGR
jgi:hypothetical protein